MVVRFLRPRAKKQSLAQTDDHIIQNSAYSLAETTKNSTYVELFVYFNLELQVRFVAKDFGFERAAEKNFELDANGISEIFLTRRSLNPKSCCRS